MGALLGSKVAVNELLYPAGPVGPGQIITHAGTVLGGLELQGIDPNGLSAADYERVSLMQRHLFQTLHRDLVLTQYYFHYKGARVTFADRDHPRSRLLSERRQQFLNEERGLSASRLFWLLECRPAEDLNRYLSTSFLRTLFVSPFDATSRQKLMAKLSHRQAWVADVREVGRQRRLVHDSLLKMDRVASMVSPDNKVMSTPELWALMRGVVNVNPNYLHEVPRHVATDDWDRQLCSGDVEPVEIDGIACLKVHGAVPMYCRIASVIGYGGESVPYAMWGQGDAPPTMLPGNYLVMTRACPLHALERGLFLKGKGDEIQRSQINFSAAMRGDTAQGEFERRVAKSDHLKKMLQELEEAAYTPDTYWHYQSYIVVFDTDPRELREATRQMDQALVQSGMRVVWETAGLMTAYPAILPAYPKRDSRVTQFTTTQVGAASLLFRSHEGCKTWTFNSRQEEALYVFESEDGSPFHYTPFVGDKCLQIGVGPTRSGKSFAKNVMAAHFMKFGGFYHALGVDAGDEPLAKFYKEDGGIFRIENPETSRGFNPFITANGTDDSAFKSHMLTQLRLMLKLNDSEMLQGLDPHEQQELDEALLRILELRAVHPRLMNLTGLYKHLSSGLQMKLQRWVKGNVYGNLFDNVEDGIGALTKRVSVYNLAGVKDTPRLAQLVMNEIFFRVIRLFESPGCRHLPKFLETDEAQYIFQVPGAADLAIAKARTWFKHGGGMGFWTQSPQHYGDLPEWETLRSAATTFIFMADKEMSRDQYRTVFNLRDGELDAIERLIPRQQAYIVQREIGVSKTVNLRVAPEEYVLATSRPSESLIVQKMLETYPDVDEAMTHMVKAIFNKESKS